jgi:DNA primase
MSHNFVDFRQIKREVSMESVLKHYDIHLRRVNQNSLRGKCPLPTHSSQKSSESFGVEIEKNVWACQSSSCAEQRDGRKGGNVIDFVAVMENSSIVDAARKLERWFLQITTSAVVEKSNEKERKEKLIAEKKEAEGVEELNKPLPFTLKGIDPAHPYVGQRGLKEDTARHFGVGFFPGRGSMSSRLVIPISNERGELVAYAGRAIDSAEPKYKLPAGFKKSDVLFNLHRVLALAPPSRDPVIVVEGFLDCMHVHQSGLPQVVALMGVSLSETQEKFICQFPRIILFLDGDEAGRQATQTIASRLTSKTFVKVVNLPDGRQPDQLSSDEIKTALSF